MESVSLLLDVLRCIKQKKDIHDEFVYDIWDYLAEYIDREEIFNKTFKDLSEELDSLLAYGGLDNGVFSTEQSFFYGAIWGAMGLVKAILQKKAKIEQREKLVKKYMHGIYFHVLCDIADNPGIQNKTLARSYKITTARVSQIINDMDADKLISVLKMGNEKYYYLKAEGKAIYGLIKGEESLTNMKTEVAAQDKVISSFYTSYIDKNWTSQPNIEVIRPIIRKNDPESVFFESRNVGLKIFVYNDDNQKKNKMLQGEKNSIDLLQEDKEHVRMKALFANNSY